MEACKITHELLSLLPVLIMTVIVTSTFSPSELKVLTSP